MNSDSAAGSFFRFYFSVFHLVLSEEVVKPSQNEQNKNSIQYYFQN